MTQSTEPCIAMSSGKAWIACLGLLLGACTYQQSWPVAADAGALRMEDNGVGDVFITSNDGRGHVWDGTQWVDAGPSPSEVKLNQQAQRYVDDYNNQKLQKSGELKTRCEKMFWDLRIGMRIEDGGDPIKPCAKMSSYTRTSHKKDEVWTWNGSSGKSVHVENGVLTTINVTPPATAQ